MDKRDGTGKEGHLWCSVRERVQKRNERDGGLTGTGEGPPGTDRTVRRTKVPRQSSLQKEVLSVKGRRTEWYGLSLFKVIGILSNV